MDAKAVGRAGEDAACAYLENLGHRILARNFRSGRVELDIVSMDASGIHFVEVKSRMAPAAADPLVNVGPAKMKNLQKAAQGWLHSPERRPLQGRELFFDIITVVLSDHTKTINYYPQAFIPIYV